MVQRFGALDMMRTMVGVLREVSLEDIREQANLAPRFLVVGPSAEQARALGLEITGPEGQFATIARGALEPVDAVGRLDAAVIWDPERTGVGSRVAEALRFESPPVPIWKSYEIESTSATGALRKSSAMNLSDGFAPIGST